MQGKEQRGVSYKELLFNVRRDLVEKKREAELLLEAHRSIERIVEALVDEERVLAALCEDVSAPLLSREPAVVHSELRVPVEDELARSEAEFKRSLVGLYADVPPGVDGQAPVGFASIVREIAYRSIEAAGRPLDRNAILVNLVATGLPLPEKGLKEKISKVLAMDHSLENYRRVGYWPRHAPKPLRFPSAAPDRTSGT